MTYGLSCTDTTNGTNPFDNYFAPHDKKKKNVSLDLDFSPPPSSSEPRFSTPTTTHATPSPSTRNIINGAYPHRDNSGQIALIAGTIYVLRLGFRTPRFTNNVRMYFNIGGGGHFRSRLGPGLFDSPADSIQFALESPRLGRRMCISRFGLV
ncbi:MAG: hypothetical protein L6R40_007411 [Gallowayella cf. fulva]|nr:MAG: hypothetical protein L6R40_007411 [Xanthomendoza cf. fulva]